MHFPNPFPIPRCPIALASSLSLHIQELGAIFWIRQNARLVFAEDSIAITRHNFVDCIAKPPRQYAAGSCQTPNAPELRQHVKDRIRPRQQSFIRSLAVFYYINGVEVVWVYATSCHQVVCKFAL